MVGMYFLIFAGNMDDIEWHDLQRSYKKNTIPAPLGVYWEILPKGQYFFLYSKGQISRTHSRLENIDNASAMIQIGTMQTFASRQNANQIKISQI